MEILIIVLGYVPAILYYLMGGDKNMEWSLELIASIVIPVLSIIASVFISTRSGNGKVNSAKADLSKEHTELKGSISNEHTALEGKISNEHLALKAEIVQTQNNITLAQNSISGKIDTLDRIINNEIIRKENLSPDQSRIDKAVDIIKGGWDSVIRENRELQQQVLQLQQENAKLKCEIDRLSADNSESDEWEQ